MEAAENLQVVHFEFSGTHIWSAEKDLEKFCVKYGNFISRLVLDGEDRPPLIGFYYRREIAAGLEVIFRRNMKRFLRNCNSLTELTLFLSEYEMERKPLKAPQLSSVTIAYGLLKRAFKIMSNLATTNPGANLRLKKLCLPQADDAELLKFVVAEQVPRNIAEMDIIVEFTDFTKTYSVESLSSEEIHLLNGLSDWVVKSMDVLEGLTLEVRNGFDEFEIFDFSSVFTLPKPLLPVLRRLNLENIMLRPVDHGVLQCPLLQEIRVGKHIKVSSFSGSVFDQVKSASIYVTTEEEFQPWPSILPNVETLQIVGELLEGVFEFHNN